MRRCSRRVRGECSPLIANGVALLTDVEAVTAALRFNLSGAPATRSETQALCVQFATVMRQETFGRALATGRPPSAIGKSGRKRDG